MVFVVQKEAIIPSQCVLDLHFPERWGVLYSVRKSYRKIRDLFNTSRVRYIRPNAFSTRGVLLTRFIKCNRTLSRFDRYGDRRAKRGLSIRLKATKTIFKLKNALLSCFARLLFLIKLCL